MKVETIADVIHWTREFHRLLSNCLQRGQSASKEERVRMLLGYLSEHESKLADVLEDFESRGETGALHTWSYDYLDDHPVKPHPDCDKAYDEMTAEEVMQQVEHEHNQIIGLYKHLRGRIDTPSAVDVIDQLISLEEHEAMRMSQ
ncbi:MAG: ATPase, partial [Pseudomonadales bacterium]|nr:ATPase [Pseudomonadales bacterium]